MIKCFGWEKNELKPFLNTEELTVGDISEKVTKLFKAIWIHLSIPIVTHKITVQLIRANHDKYRNLLKLYKERKTM